MRGALPLLLGLLAALVLAPAAQAQGTVVEVPRVVICWFGYTATSGDVVIAYCSVSPQGQGFNPILPGTGVAFAACADGAAAWWVVSGSYGDTRFLPLVSGCWPAF